ncbi:MAG: diguanylate cyclase domain-containing protein [Methylotenera sp.]
MKNKSDNLLPLPDLRLTADTQIVQVFGIAADSPTDRLLHELRMHQLKLEMQNEALRHTQVALEESLDRYVSLYEFAPVGYLTLTENGAIDEANLTSAELLGQDRSTLLKQPFPHFIIPEDSDRWHQHFYSAIQCGKNKSCDVRIRRADGTLVHICLDCLLLAPKNTPLLNAGALKLRVALTDITEIKLAELELRVAATVFDSQEGMMVTDFNNVILKVNEAFTHITGYMAAEVVGRTPRFLRSGRHDEEFYAGIWASIHGTGAWQGEVWNRQKNGDIFPVWLTITTVKNKDGVITHYVATLTDITTRKAAEDEMQMLAFYDPLTRLPNRRLLLDRLQRAIATSARTRRHCALMFIDLDNFKALNDNFGHDIGDMLLQKIALRFAICVREGDTVARMGGDEFMVMLENLNEDPHEAAIMAEIIGNKILSALTQPFQLAGHECFSTASIGVTLFTNHRYTVPELQKQADIAMYQAKSAGRNKLWFFKSDS